MEITRCVPLPGPGLVARYGDLVVVTDGRAPGADPLVGVLTAVAAAAADGTALVRGAVRAALDCAGRPAWACAGVTADGAVAVLVHGGARAVVRVDDGQDVQLTAADSLIPVSRTFTGRTVACCLAVFDPPPADPRFCLDGGVVPGGGLAVTMSAGPAGQSGQANGATRLVAPSNGESAPAPAGQWRPPPAAAPMEAAVSLDEAPVTELDGLAGAVPSRVPDTRERHQLEPEPVMVEGVLCARGDFNDPAARRCAWCGISLDHPSAGIKVRRRPSLGVLLVDDGTRYPLDRDYIIGREPVLDGDVAARRATPLRIADPAGTVSRLHLRVSLVGWQVRVEDLRSANGSVLHSPDGARPLEPFAPTPIEPGALIGLGDRSVRYLSPRDGAEALP
jgi:hypothetical protein